MQAGTKKYVVTHIYMMGDNTSQQMNAMAGSLEDLFSPLILVALSIVSEKIEPPC